MEESGQSSRILVVQREAMPSVIFRGLRDRALLWVVPTLVVLFHILFLRGYGWFRDEFYYYACARHLAFGYVDHPPLSIVPLWIVRTVAGDSLVAARLLASLASGAIIAVVGLTTRDIGGGRFAQALAMVCAAVAPVYLALGSFYSMNIFDVLAWGIAGWLVVKLLQAPTLSTWIALGVVLGLGVQNKISVLWLIGGLSIGLLIGDFRRLMTLGPWVAALVAVVLIAPYVVWQVTHGWPTIEFIQRASADKMAAQSPWSFLSAQILDLHPLTLPVWLGGLWFFLIDRRGRSYQALGVMFLCVLALLIANKTSRSGYLSPAYTVLFAGGACWFEPLLARLGRALQPIVIGVLAAGGLVTAPLAMPMLPVTTYINYAAMLGQKPSTEEKKAIADLPQFYADRFGWQELVAAVSRAYETLTPDERRVAGIFTSNYGEAGAIDVLGRAGGLPYAISGHNNYWLWGPDGHTGEVLIVLTPSRGRLAALFEDVRLVGTIECDHCMPYENHRPVFVCRRARLLLAQIWPQVKHFD
jgi:Dolichyl-phosphate-mannose-protein mannosyltransferase